MFIQYSVNWDKIQTLKQQKLQEMHSFFFRELQPITVLFLIHNSFCGILRFQFCFVLFKKSVDYLNLKVH